MAMFMGFPFVLSGREWGKLNGFFRTEKLHNPIQFVSENVQIKEAPWTA
jgi:hypothetical protein